MSLSDRIGDGHGPFDGIGKSGAMGGTGGMDIRPGGLRNTAKRYALLPLRLFLGVTFTYAGLDKLTDPGFLSGSGADSFTGLLHGVQDAAAASWLVDLALKSPEGFGYAIACAEVAVGLATLAGLWARLAAVGGAVLSLVFWLTVSWSAEPYYYGNDLPYLMAWTPLIVLGSPLLSLDGLFHARRRRKGQHIFG